MTEERRRELSPMIFQKEWAPEALESLSIQENIFLLHTMEEFQKQSALSNYEEKYDVLYQHLLKRIKEAETLYVLMDKSTGFPFINRGAVDLFSEKQLAEKGKEALEKQFRKLEIREIHAGEPVEYGENLFAYFALLGMDAIMVDNGAFRIMVDRKELEPTPVIPLPRGTAKLENPLLREALLEYMQEIRWTVKYEQRADVIRQLEQDLFEVMRDARFLVAVRPPEGLPPNLKEGEPLPKNTPIQIPLLTASDQKKFLAVFTDWTEFLKVYQLEKWKGLLVTLKEIMPLMKQADGVVFNPRGENMTVLKENMTKVLERTGEKA